MCGIAGIYNLDGRPIETGQLLEMTRRIRYRGPDDEGFMLAQTQKGTVIPCHHDESIAGQKAQTEYLTGNSTRSDLGFGFRRLSILDLSPKGHQPMASADGRYWIVFNGEIYNYLELRTELAARGQRFVSNTDTEVILAAYRVWGTSCLQRFNGMWAFAIWDSRDRRLFAARDRFGIKPLVYFFDGRRFIFGSELKQLLLHDIPRRLNHDSLRRSMLLNSFLMYGDETYFKDIKALPAAHYLVLEDKKLKVQRYYDLNPAGFESFSGSFDEAVNKYNDLFRDAVKLRMRSDVEVGSCLSGGLDSSAIAATAGNLARNNFQTFSAYYDLGPAYDERKWIALLADNHNLKSNLVQPRADDFWQQFDRMTAINDYPVTGASFISQYYVMRLAHEHGVTVLLDGQGSDEITGGYNHTFYRYFADLLRRGHWGRFAAEFPSYLRVNAKGSPLAKISKTLFAVLAGERTIYRQEARRLMPQFLQLEQPSASWLDRIRSVSGSRLADFLYNLVSTTMIQTLLHFEDRNSMAASIESRVPFLDYRLVEFAFTLPGHFKVHGNYGKYIHRKAMEKSVPLQIAQRRDKVSFASPGEALWLKKQLRPHVEDILQSTQFRQRGLYNLKVIDGAWQRYLRGETAMGRVVWRGIALEKWLRIFMDRNTEIDWNQL